MPLDNRLEAARLATLREYDICPDQPENEFDHIVRLTAKLFDAPICLLSIVQKDNQMFKAKTGIDVCETERGISFCSHVVNLGECLIVDDAATHPAFSENPLVTGDPHIRFYAGMPLTVEAGHVLGTLCIIDNVPRAFDERDKALLRDMARLAVDRLELRRSERVRERNEKQLYGHAHFDCLTGLSNRRHFRRCAAQAMKTHTEGSVLLFDLSRFRDINDFMGENTGDNILLRVAEHLRAMPGDVIHSRFGNDEFAIFLPELANPLKLYEQASEIRSWLRSGLRIDDRLISLDAAFGFAMAPRDGDDIDALIANARLALRHAKQQGSSGRISYYATHMRNSAEQHSALQESLKKAVEHDEFELFYQPQIDLKRGRIVGAEALLRWHHPDHGIMAPGYFIGTLELMSESVEVGDRTIRKAIAQAKRWEEMGYPIRVGVNLFTSQFVAGRVSSVIQSALARHGLNSNLLEIEVTEKVAIDQSQSVLGALKSLNQLGIGIALDDFGTGYASLTALKQLPASRLKIDRQFVSGACTDGEDAAVVEAFVGFGERLGLDIIAEGVETAEEQAWLERVGCYQMQGFRFGRPMPASDFTEMLLSQRNDLKIAL